METTGEGMGGGRPTVHDLARHAGVSLATVDRVLNGRPGVRPEKRALVTTAIEALGFVRDLGAANLAKGRVYPLAFVVPAGDNSFMRQLTAEIGEARARGSVERTRIELVSVPPFDAPALVEALDRLEAQPSAGVALVATDDPAVVAAVDRLKAAGIPVVTLVSDLPESGRDHFVGVDNVAAGRTAASLLGRFVGARPGRLLVLSGSMRVRDHRQRLDGFSAVIAERFPGLAVLPVLEGRDDPALAGRLVEEALAADPGIVGLYSLGGGNRGLVEALQRRGKPGPVVAHELTATTRAALDAGLFDAVLNQDPGHEVRSAIRVLKAKADGLPVIAAQERIRIDIFLKDNLP